VWFQVAIVLGGCEPAVGLKCAVRGEIVRGVAGVFGDVARGGVSRGRLERVSVVRSSVVASIIIVLSIR